MFRIQITGDAPGAAHLVHTYEDRMTAERVAQALVRYFSSHKLPDYQQGVQVFDEEGHCVWQQISGLEPQHLN